MTTATRDHGGGLDAAAAAFGGTREDWLDLSTGINPMPYPVPEISQNAWTALPDQEAMERLLGAARRFWNVPEAAQIIAAPGASALIARMPYLLGITGSAYIPGPTYNEHAAAVRAVKGMEFGADPATAAMHVYVHPNNPDGRLWSADHIADRPLTVIDESFCDVKPEATHISQTIKPGVVVLKSFGKFWGLAGLRLGFAIAAPGTLAPADAKATMQDHLGPWAVSGPALDIGTKALNDNAWAETTRARLTQDAARLDLLMNAHGARTVGGTSLFRLYDVPNAADWQTQLATHHIWTRVFPYNPRWLRLGLPDSKGWEQLETALT